MKIRKGLLAAATAASVSLTGVVAAPAFAADATTGVNQTQKSEADKLKAEREYEREKIAKERQERHQRVLNDENATFQEKSSVRGERAFTNAYGEADLAKITGWIALAGSIVGLISQLYTLINRMAR